MNTESVTTHQLRKGDVILCDGMTLLIDSDLRQTSHPVSDYGGKTFAVAAAVLNWEQVVASAESGNTVSRFIVGIIRSDMSPDGHLARNGRTPYEVPRWTIQGNGLARWSRVLQ